MNDGQWHHIAVVLEGGEATVGMSDIIMYIDGVKCDIAAVPDGQIETVFGQDVMIGAINVSGNIINRYSGILDDVRMYNRALSGVEIEGMYKQAAK